MLKTLRILQLFLQFQGLNVASFQSSFCDGPELTYIILSLFRILVVD